MEEVLATPSMQETIRRLLGDRSTEGQGSKRRQTLLTAYTETFSSSANGRTV